MKSLFLLFFLLNSLVFAQRSSLDSLKREASKLARQPQTFSRDTALAQYLAETGRINVDINADSATFYIDSTYRFLKLINWEKGWGHYYRAKGVYEMEMGANADASEYLIKSLKIFEKYNDQAKLASVLVSNGINLAYSKKYDEAIKYHQKSIEIYQKLNMPAGVLTNYTNIGNTYLIAKKYKDALKYFTLYKELLPKTNVSNRLDRQCINAINLSICYYRLNDENRGKFYEDEALKIAAELKGVYEFYILYEELASCFLEQNKFQKSIEYANRAFPFANQLKSYEKISTINGILYKDYKALGNTKTALEYYEKHVLMEDSLDRTKAREKITELQLKYDTEKQENKINELKLENIEQEQNKRLSWAIGGVIILGLIAGFIFWNYRSLKRKNAELEQKNHEIIEALLKGQTIERKRVAADLHDNLGGNIAAMRLQMLGIDRSKFSETELNAYNEVLAMIQESYRQVRGLSHNLMPEILENEGLVKALEKLVDKLNNGGLIEFEFINHNLEKRLEPQQELELYSVCLESINNIIKHSKASQAGIELSKNDTQIDLKISDNGKGIEKDKLEKGMGLSSIENRINALNGSWEIDSELDRGTTFLIKIPVDDK
jgi:two-component system, NarL family, sensor kinase